MFHMQDEKENMGCRSKRDLLPCLVSAFFSLLPSLGVMSCPLSYFERFLFFKLVFPEVYIESHMVNGWKVGAVSPDMKNA